MKTQNPKREQEIKEALRPKPRPKAKLHKLEM